MTRGTDTRRTEAETPEMRTRFHGGRGRGTARARGEIGNGDEEGDGCARVVRPSVRPSLDDDDAGER